MYIKELRQCGKDMGRERLAQRALEIAREIVEADSYKEAIIGAGRMLVIAKACSYDDYWGEKANIGEYNEYGKIDYLAYKARQEKSK